nr:histidinol-phosphate transaminase [Kofleriaceae bacterium]
MNDAFVPAHVKGLDVYQPGKPIEELERELGISGAIKVASNENPLGPSPRALAALPAALPNLHLYPDAGGFALRRAIADHLGVAMEQIALGNGSNDILYQLVLATCDGSDQVLSHREAFLSYRLAAQVLGREYVAAPVTADHACDVGALIAAITPRTKLVVIGTPNNPTGSVVTRADADRVLAALPARALLVIDEAYAEYAAAYPEVDHADGLALGKRDPRVVVLRTFSKIYGLAGLRVGYALADKLVVDTLGRVGRTFHVSSLAHVGAIAALGDRVHVERSAKQARGALERVRAEVRGPGVKVFPTLANFVLIECGRPSTPVYDRLLRLGVIVRPLAAWGLPTCLRVSIARDGEMSRVIGALNDVLA